MKTWRHRERDNETETQRKIQRARERDKDKEWAVTEGREQRKRPETRRGREADGKSVCTGEYTLKYYAAMSAPTISGFSEPLGVILRTRVFRLETYLSGQQARCPKRYLGTLASTTRITLGVSGRVLIWATVVREYASLSLPGY
eukprot:1754977-Rhodomonas_salina.1